MANTIMTAFEHDRVALARLEQNRDAGPGDRKEQGRGGCHESGSIGFEEQPCWQCGGESEAVWFEVEAAWWVSSCSAESEADREEVCVGKSEEMRSGDSVSSMVWKCARCRRSAGSIVRLVLAQQILGPISAISARIVDLTPDSSSTRRGEYARAREE
jgi:hypothetical protein